MVLALLTPHHPFRNPERPSAPLPQAPPNSCSNSDTIYSSERSASSGGSQHSSGGGSPRRQQLPLRQWQRLFQPFSLA